MTNADLALALKADFELFTRYMFYKQNGNKMVVKPFHKRIFAAMTKVAAGQTKRLVITIPPRYGKTEIAVKSFVAWCIANNTAAKFIHLSYSKNIALDNSRDIRETVRSEAFQDIFPTLLKLDSNSVEKWYTQDGGGIYATATAGQVTGFGAGSKTMRKEYEPFQICKGFGGCIIIDDPLKPDDAFSQPRRLAVNRRLTNTVKSRLNQPQETPIIVIMQRLHVDDMAGYVMRGDDGDDWEVLNIPVIEDGQPIWPEKHTIEMLDSMKNADSYTFSSQYMQEPIIVGGDLIKGAWFGRYEVQPIYDYRIIVADTALKAGQHNDYTVFQCWGKKDGRIYLIDQLRGKWEALELERIATDFIRKHQHVVTGGYLRYTAIEDKASGTELIQRLKKAGFPFKAIQRNKDKFARLMDARGFIESGFVMLPNKPFVSEFIQECEAFTADNRHTHDDQIDPMLDAIELMLRDTSGFFIDGA